MNLPELKLTNHPSLHLMLMARLNLLSYVDNEVFVETSEAQDFASSN